MSGAVTDITVEIVRDQSPEETKESSLGLLVETSKRDSPEVNDKVEKDSEEVSVHADPSVVENLAKGVLNEHVHDLKKFQSTLTDLTKNQRLLIDTVQQENARFAEMQGLYNVEDMFQRVKLYHSKLVKIKKEMTDLYQRSKKLKKRALRLHQQKQKEALQLEQQREREEERERHLMAKVAVKPRS